MTQHTPGPCKCRIAYAYRPEQAVIDYCPLHAAAPEMLELLRLVAQHINGECDHVSDCAFRAHALLAKLCQTG